MYDSNNDLKKINKVIFHIDGDSFFVNAHVSICPELKNKLVCVCSNKKDALILAASYNLKQKGIYVPMKLYEAKKIVPNLITINPNYNLYSSISNQIFSFLKSITNQVEIGSIDEWYLDVSSKWQKFGSFLNMAKYIQKSISTLFNIDVSIGISYNKFFAKIATDLKKPKGISIISPNNYKEIIWPLKLNDFCGIGKKNLTLFNQQNIFTIGDLANLNLAKINLKKINMTYNQIEKLKSLANGLDYRNVNQNKNFITSVSSTISPNKQIYLDKKEDILNLLSLGIDKYINKIKYSGILIKDICVVVQFIKKEYDHKTQKLDFFTNDESTIEYFCNKLFFEVFNNNNYPVVKSIEFRSILITYDFSLLKKNLNLFTTENNVNNNIDLNTKPINLINYINSFFNKKVSFTLKELKETKSLLYFHNKHIK